MGSLKSESRRSFICPLSGPPYIRCYSFRFFLSSSSSSSFSFSSSSLNSLCRFLSVTPDNFEAEKFFPSNSFSLQTPNDGSILDMSRLFDRCLVSIGCYFVVLMVG